MIWDEDILPTIYTPVNTLESLQQKRILMVLWYADEFTKEQIVVAQANILMNQFIEAQGEKDFYSMNVNEVDLVFANSVVGKMNFKVDY